MHPVHAVGVVKIGIVRFGIVWFGIARFGIAQLCITQIGLRQVDTPLDSEPRPSSNSLVIVSRRSARVGSDRSSRVIRNQRLSSPGKEFAAFVSSISALAPIHLSCDLP